MGLRLSDVEAEPRLVAVGDEWDRRYDEDIETTRSCTDEFVPPDGLLVVLRDRPLAVCRWGFRRHDVNTCQVTSMWTC
jgi:hypothetical protein